MTPKTPRTTSGALTTLDMVDALRHLRRVDSKLVPLIEEHGPPNFKKTTNSFEALAKTIIAQQLSGAAARTIYGRFLALFATRRFPTPAALLAVSPQTLRSAGLSNAKASALRDLAEKLSDGTLKTRRFRQLTNEELVSTLTQVKGIGPWSVDMFLMFALCRPDVLPVGDLGVRKGMQRHFSLRQLPAAKRMAKLAQPWQPYRSVASWYMWRLLEQTAPLT